MTLAKVKERVAEIGENPTDDQIASVGVLVNRIDDLAEYREALEIYVELVDRNLTK